MKKEVQYWKPGYFPSYHQTTFSSIRDHFNVSLTTYGGRGSPAYSLVFPKVNCKF